MIILIYIDSGYLFIYLIISLGTNRQNIRLKLDRAQLAQLFLIQGLTFYTSKWDPNKNYGNYHLVNWVHTITSGSHGPLAFLYCLKKWAV